jgi:TorA maturation chaperone TorD
MTASRTENLHLEAARAEVYRFFAALLLTQPTPGLLGGLLTERGASALDALFPQHPVAARFRELVEHYSRGTWRDEDFLLDYESMFRVPGDAYIHPFESVYRNQDVAMGQPNRLMILGPHARGVARMYQAEGLGPREDLAELPDHLGVELEFMAFLCGQTAVAIEAGDAETATAFRCKQHTFLMEHLLTWGPECLGKIEEGASTPLYRYLAGLLKSFLEEESCSLKS